jgi:hypothetical protein
MLSSFVKCRLERPERQQRTLFQTLRPEDALQRGRTAIRRGFKSTQPNFCWRESSGFIPFDHGMYLFETQHGNQS